MSAPLENQTPPLAANCLVCGIPLVGLTAVFLRWRGIRRSPRNLNCCTQCGAHLEEGRLVEMTVVFADLSSFTEMTGRLGATTTYSVVDEFLRGYFTAVRPVILEHSGRLFRSIPATHFGAFRPPSVGGLSR
jgi:class 3 adenylate cyclase